MKRNISIHKAAVLLVDCERKCNTLLAGALRQSGYENIFSTTDSGQVESLCDKYDFDLIILNISESAVDDFDVIKRLQSCSEKSEIPIIVLTSLIDPDICNRALQSGAVDFLIKPFNQMEMLNRIGNALETRLLYKHVKNCNEQLEEKVAERTNEVYETRIKVIRRLSRAAEFRDNETGLHVIRMSQYSYLLAKTIGMSQKDCEIVLNASPLHDIGKIGIPDRILLKPGKLNKNEWEIMKSHTYIGMEILEGGNCELLKAAHTIAMTHHEKWDGSGYPNGLAGEEIPLIGRVVAVADVFDALTSERPYKKAWSLDDAFNLLINEKARHFDPGLVDAFVALAPELKGIRRAYSEGEDLQHHSYLESVS